MSAVTTLTAAAKDSDDWRGICALEEVQILRACLQDIVMGAQMMRDPCMSADCRRYAAEVQRVAQIALASRVS
jgi:hypothetical protein